MDIIGENLLNKLSDFSVSLLGALITLLVGFKIVSILIKLLKKGRGFNKLDKSVQTFLTSFLSIFLKAAVIIAVLANLGVPMTSLVTIFGSATLAIGLAIQGGLTNLVGGLLILIFKPFKVGDTVINNLDNTRIVLPNGELANTSIKNFSHNGERKVCIDFSVDYSSDIDKVKEVLAKVIDEEPLINKDKEIFIKLTNHADSALIFTVRVWTKNSDFWTLKFNLLENVKKAFDKEGISIPFPQVDVHMKNK